MFTELIKITVDIISRQNPAIIASCALRDKKTRDETGLFCFEGDTLLGELLDSGALPQRVFLSESFTEKKAERTNELLSLSRTRGFELKVVSDSVYDKLTELSSPEGVFCVCSKDAFGKGDRPDENSRLFKRGVIICEGLRDPGNVGTVLRCAAAFEIGAVFLCGCADIFSPKTLRGAMGALFHIDAREYASVSAAAGDARCAGLRLYAAALHKDSVPLEKLLPIREAAVLIGSEGSGLSDEALSLADGLVNIPTSFESLNAAVAASVFMYEMARGRAK